MEARMLTPFNCIISGASKSGKTTLVRNLLSIKTLIFSTPPDFIILVFKYHQPIYNEMKNTGLINELISLDSDDSSIDILKEKIQPFVNGNGSLIILDDSMTQMTNDFEQFFTNISHHNNCSVIFLTQNLFYGSKTYRTMSLNAHYIFLMRSARDKQQITTLAKQIYPENISYLVEAYKDATKYPYSYLMIDCSPESASDVLQLRSKIFPTEFPCTLYVRNKKNEFSQ